MKLCHFIKITVFAKIDEGEQEQPIEDTLKALALLDEKDLSLLHKQTATGFEEKRIRILEITLDKDRLINRFLKHLTEKLSKAQKDLLLRQMESRLDPENHFFLRLDKDNLLLNDYAIVDHGDCFHINCTIACFPTTREVAKKVVQQIFSS